MDKFGAKLLLIMAVMALSGLFLVACGDDEDYIDEGPATDTPTPRPTREPSGGNGDNGEAGGEIEIAMGDNFFEPKNIEVPVNTKMKIVVKNQGAAVHNMHVLSKDKEGKDFASKMLVNPGTDDDFEVQFKNTGTYNFQCDYHLPQMVGTITVK